MPSKRDELDPAWETPSHEPTDLTASSPVGFQLRREFGCPKDLKRGPASIWSAYYRRRLKSLNHLRRAGVVAHISSTRAGSNHHRKTGRPGRFAPK